MNLSYFPCSLPHARINANQKIIWVSTSCPTGDTGRCLKEVFCFFINYYFHLLFSLATINVKTLIWSLQSIAKLNWPFYSVLPHIWSENLAKNSTGHEISQDFKGKCERQDILCKEIHTLCFKICLYLLIHICTTWQRNQSFLVKSMCTHKINRKKSLIFLITK